MSNVPKYDNDKRNNLGGKKILSPLAKALKDFVGGGYYSNDKYEALERELKHVWGKYPYQLETADEFLNRRFLSSIKELVGKEWCDDIADMVRICTKGQFSSSSRRRSYRSRSFSYYGVNMLYKIKGWIDLSCYRQTPEEMLTYDTGWTHGYSEYLALQLCRKNPVYVNAAREMILGDNNTHLLSRSMIIGILLSGNEELTDLLLKLLLAAKGQEGLRQAILESADAGSLESFKKIFQCCIDNDLFRFTSAARALYAWTGIYIEDVDIATSRKIAAAAWDCLSNPQKREEYLESKNPFDLYFALWAKGCEDIAEVDSLLESLLNSSDIIKKYVGWYFVCGVENTSYRHRKAAEHLDEEDISVLALATDNLHVNTKACYAYTYNRKDYSAQTFPDPVFDGIAKERRELFYKLKPVAERIGNNEWKIDGYLFPWSRLVINQKNAEVLRCMFSLAGYDLDSEMIDELYQLREYMDSDLRKAFYINFLDPDKNKKHRSYVYDGLKDRSIYNKQAAIEKLKLCRPCKEDIDNLCSLLTSKSSSLKKSVMDYLKELVGDDLEYAVGTLLDGGESEIQAASELILAHREYADKFDGKIESLKTRSFSDQTAVLFEQLIQKPEDAQGGSDGLKYGLFSEDAVQKAVEEAGAKRFKAFLPEKEFLALYPSEKEVMDLVEKIHKVFERHADYEFTVEEADGNRKKVLFGDAGGYWPTIQFPAEYGQSWKLKYQKTGRLYMLPFADEFKDILKEYLQDASGMIMLCYATHSSERFSKPQQWIQPFLKKFNLKITEACYAKYGTTYRRCLEVIELGIHEIDQEEAAKTLIQAYFSLSHILKENNLSRTANEKLHSYDADYAAGNCSIFSEFRSLIARLKFSDEVFDDWFRGEYYLEHSQGYGYGSCLGLREYLRAVDRKLIPLDCLYDWLLSEDVRFYRNGPVAVMTTPASSEYKEYCEIYPWFSDMVKELVDKSIRFESKRGQSVTPISDKVANITHFEGMEYFVMLLKSLGKDNFFRGYVWSSDNTKSTTLSMLLRKCWPAESDDAKGLKELITNTGITEKRLIEAAMYAPQWSSLIEEIIGWPGLKKAVWFFQAHISEHFSSDKETEVALYSPISPQHFNDGAFDVEWFNDVYSQLGEKRFKLLYNSAKYLTNGSNAHKRSQLYVDAVTGKLDPDQMEKEIQEKRNQERLRAYALIPVNEDQLLHRYLFINQYLKDSKKFGAQRRESEKKATAVALENLAISSGYFDVNRMLWKLEGEKNREILPLLEKKNIDGYELSISIDEKGDASLIIEKDGKALKSAPKSLAKNAYLEDLKTVVKELKDQRTRGKNTLEQSMIDKTKYTASELGNILESLTVAPLAKDLLWKCNDCIGYLDKAESGFILKDYEGTVTEIKEGDELILAHPHHLYVSGHWADFMHQAYEDRLIQPFKQIFREYYPITDEEKEEKTLSRRYAGYQVQPKKTAALLKSRGWTVDYEEGLQKVCYADDILVRMYAEADWFSPADIEAPTLEEIRFSSRKSGEPIALEDVDPIVFSEIMRDIDLVVSVAYVGGVDAETSHSTVEMRVAIAKELVQLMKLGNVEFTERHARIHGSLADYSVHMGSGIVHAGDKGMIPILPVHSQHRGRIFLPFADEDPKTAEIMSKIILLSEDTKIKDPEILSRLK